MTTKLTNVFDSKHYEKQREQMKRGTLWCRLHKSPGVLLVGSTEEGQVILVNVLGDVKAVGLDQLLVLRQLVLLKTKQ